MDRKQNSGARPPIFLGSLCLCCDEQSLSPGPTIGPKCKQILVGRRFYFSMGRHRQLKIDEFLLDPHRISKARERLPNLSWFMRFLNHPIACQANREDGCTGHFWESRFKSFALLDEEAIIACMAYVDLNPIRTKEARTLLESDHTSFQRRLIAKEIHLKPLGSTRKLSRLSLNLDHYVDYLEQTGLIADSRSPPDLRVRTHVLYMGSYQWVYGTQRSIASWCNRVGQRWIHGLPLAY